MRWLTNFLISATNEQLQQQLEYTLLKPDCHSGWISKMQSRRADTLEERYAIKVCFKLGKNATETYGMFQNAFWPSCMNRASVFEWNKRFKEAGSLWGMMRGELFEIELFLTLKLYLHLNCVLMLKWIIWNGTVFDIETVLSLNWIVINNCLNSLK